MSLIIQLTNYNRLLLHILSNASCSLFFGEHTANMQIGMIVDGTCYLKLFDVLRLKGTIKA
ncbi:hypothetical protein [Paenibacillus kribbensis]|uniref:hypothetical protein n=1 Tax=Paenibacillus kribbensis TaxID=172713 RepID=UPI0035940633